MPRLRLIVFAPVWCAEAFPIKASDDPGLETVTQQLLNETEGMAWRRSCAEPTITPVVLVNG